MKRLIPLALLVPVILAGCSDGQTSETTSETSTQTSTTASTTTTATTSSPASETSVEATTESAVEAETSAPAQEESAPAGEAMTPGDPRLTKVNAAGDTVGIFFDSTSHRGDGIYYYVCNGGAATAAAQGSPVEPGECAGPLDYFTAQQMGDQLFYAVGRGIQGEASAHLNGNGN